MHAPSSTSSETFDHLDTVVYWISFKIIKQRSATQMYQKAKNPKTKCQNQLCKTKSVLLFMPALQGGRQSWHEPSRFPKGFEQWNLGSFKNPHTYIFRMNFWVFLLWFLFAISWLLLKANKLAAEVGSPPGKSRCKQKHKEKITYCACCNLKTYDSSGSLDCNLNACSHVESNKRYYNFNAP